MTFKVTGGDRLKRHLAARKRQAKAVGTGKGRRYTVGFHGRIAALAALHEYGAGALPERPAFRAGARHARQQFKRDGPRVAREVSRGSSPSALTGKMERLVIDGQRAIKDSYLGFRGTPLSKRQRARKAGTPFESVELQGAEGPKMIDHIEARDESGKEIGGS